MARRKEFKNIAAGLHGSFISRNNDVDGYWGIGKLFALAEKHDVASVRIDLLSELITPQSKKFDRLLRTYMSFLHERMSAREMPSTWLKSAVIELEFRLDEWPQEYEPRNYWGDPFYLKVVLVDDMGREYSVSGYGRCKKHSPLREQRRLFQDRK